MSEVKARRNALIDSGFTAAKMDNYLKELFHWLLTFKGHSGSVWTHPKSTVLKSLTFIAQQIQQNSDSISPFFANLCEVFVLILSPNNDPEIRSAAWSSIIAVIKAVWNRDMPLASWERIFQTALPPLPDLHRFPRLRIGNKAEYGPDTIIKWSEVFLKEVRACAVRQMFEYFWRLIVGIILPLFNEKNLPNKLIRQNCDIMHRTAIVQCLKSFRDSPALVTPDVVTAICQSLDVLKGITDVDRIYGQVIMFYKYVFSCDFLIISERSIRSRSVKIMKKKLMDLIGGHGWGGPLNLAYFDAVPTQTASELLEEVFRKFGDARIQQLVSMLDPGFMIISHVVGLIRARLDAAEPVLDSKLLAKLLGLFLRLRTIIRILFRISRAPEAIVSFLCCLFLNQSRDMHLFMASFYFTIVFDLKQVNFVEALNFARNIVKMAAFYDPSMTTSMPQLFSHIAAHTSAALAPVLLGLAPDELPALLENPVIFSHEKIPNLTLKVIGKRINTRSIFF
jgi:hypothetical protein